MNSEMREAVIMIGDLALPFGMTDRVDVEFWFHSSLGDRRFCETGPERQLLSCRGVQY